MKSKLGITLRKIRKGKKISLSSIADMNVENQKYLVLGLSMF